MSTQDKVGPLVYALAPLAAFLAIALVLQGWRGSHATAILNTPPSKITSAQPPHALTLTDDLQIIQERPLFYASRKFYDPVLATPPTTRSQLSSYQLMGTLLLPQKPGIAFLRRGPAGETTTLSPRGSPRRLDSRGRPHWQRRLRLRRSAGHTYDHIGLRKQFYGPERGNSPHAYYSTCTTPSKCVTGLSRAYPAQSSSSVLTPRPYTGTITSRTATQI